MEDGPRDKLLDGLSQYLGRSKRNPVLSFHENLMNDSADEMDGKWKVQT